MFIRYRYKDGKVKTEAQFFYNDIKAKTIPLQAYLTADFNLPGGYNTPLYEGGFYGVSIPTNLISRIILKQPYLNDFETEYTYDYKLDSDGYVADMTEHRYDNTQTFISKYKYTWEPVITKSYTNWLFNDIRSPYYRILFN